MTYNYSAQTSAVTDPLGTVRTYSFTAPFASVKLAGLSQPCPSCGGSNVSAMTYDVNGNVASRTDFNGKKSCYQYDLTRNLETIRVDGLLSSESCSTGAG